jgi:hypothetical protein
MWGGSPLHWRPSWHDATAGERGAPWTRFDSSPMGRLSAGRWSSSAATGSSGRFPAAGMRPAARRRSRREAGRRNQAAAEGATRATRAPGPGWRGAGARADRVARRRGCRPRPTPSSAPTPSWRRPVPRGAAAPGGWSAGWRRRRVAVEALGWPRGDRWGGRGPGPTPANLPRGGAGTGTNPGDEDEDRAGLTRPEGSPVRAEVVGAAADAGRASHPPPRLRRRRQVGHGACRTAVPRSSGGVLLRDVAPTRFIAAPAHVGIVGPVGGVQGRPRPRLGAGGLGPRGRRTRCGPPCQKSLRHTRRASA